MGMRNLKLFGSAYLVLSIGASSLYCNYSLAATEMEKAKSDCVTNKSLKQIIIEGERLQSENLGSNSGVRGTGMSFHIQQIIECAEAAKIAKSGQMASTSCRTIENTEIKSLLEERLKNEACKHLVKVTQVNEKEVQQAVAKSDAEDQADYGKIEQDIQADESATKSGRTDTFLARLQNKTKGFLERAGITKENSLSTCAGLVGIDPERGNDNGFYTKFKSVLEDNSQYELKTAKTFKTCIASSSNNSGPGGIFKKGNSGDDNWDFFTKFGKLETSVNKQRLCEDHANNYCLPAYAYYHLCKKIEAQNPGNKEDNERCIQESSKAVNYCVTGNYAESKVPAGITSGDNSGQFNIAQVVNQENFQSIEDLAKSESKESQPYAFHKTFYEMYGTCVVLRLASKQMADDNGRMQWPEKIASVNGQYYCSRQAPWTVDFVDCASKIQWGDGLFDVAAAGTQTAIAVKQSLDKSNINKNLTKDITDGDQTAYIKAQERELERQADNSFISAGVSGGHAMTLVGLASTFPNLSQFQNACEQEMDSHYGDPVINCGMLRILNNHDGPNEMTLANGDAANMESMIFANQLVKKHFYVKAASKMADAIFSSVVGMQQNRQAGDLANIKKQYDDFYAQDAVVPDYEAVSYCDQNPSAPSCRKSNRIQTSTDSGAFGNIGFQNQGGGNFSFNKDIEDGYESEEEISAAEKAAREKLGNVIGDNKGDKLGNEVIAPGAAKATIGSAGGGGGGGGGAAGGGGGGGTAPAPNKPSGKTQQSGMTGGSSKYISGNGAGINFRPGNSPRTKSKSKNAFDNLFGSKKGRNVATTVDDIAPAKSQLFDKISKRYGQVSADKRLYEFKGE